MKRLKGLDEIHEIMEKIHEDEKGLTLEQKIKKLREERESGHSLIKNLSLEHPHTSLLREKRMILDPFPNAFKIQKE